jgi:PAS domain S-box-containing protein
MVPVARRHVLDHVIDGVITLDLRHRIVDINRAGERILNWKSGEVIGKPLPQLLKDRPQLARNITATTSGERPRNVEMKIANSYFDVQITPLKDAQEQIYAWALVLHDVTGRKQTEFELTHARDRAVEVSEAKSHFLARVSHELRTPLSVILGYVEMLMEHAGDADFLAEHKPVQRIYESIQYLNIQVNELLDLSSLDAGRLRLEELPVKLAELVAEVEAQMGILARNKRIQLTSIVDPDLPETILSDPLRLKQIMVNLVGNAVKFTEEGGIAVHAAPSGQRHWTLQVTDTGMGIPKAVQEAIFEPFQQGPGALTRARAGSGLGLSIVAELSQLMGGTIDLDSAPGKGSTFTIRLPLKTAKVGEKLRAKK